MPSAQALLSCLISPHRLPLLPCSIAPPLQVMAELFGKKTGCCRGQGGSMHMFDREFGLVGAGSWLLLPGLRLAGEAV